MIFLLAPRMSTPSRRHFAPPAQIVRLVTFGARTDEKPLVRPAASPKQAAASPRPKPEKTQPKALAPVKTAAPIVKPEPAKPKPETPVPPQVITPPMPKAPDSFMPKSPERPMPETAGKPAAKAVETPATVPPAQPPVIQNSKPVISSAGNEPAGEFSESARLSRIQQLEKRKILRESALAEKRVESPRPAVPVLSAEEMTAYHGIITQRVRQRWVFTGGGENMSAEVLIALDRNGSVRTQKITRGSGNVEFDRSVLRAIAKASPFPPPPEGADTEIQFRFRSEGD
jgi:protein TonB